jgi:hypothetical protein
MRIHNSRQALGVNKVSNGRLAKSNYNVQTTEFEGSELCAIPAWEGPGDGCKGMRVGGEGVDAALGVGGLATLESDLTGC